MVCCLNIFCYPETQRYRLSSEKWEEVQFPILPDMIWICISQVAHLIVLSTNTYIWFKLTCCVSHLLVFSLVFVSWFMFFFQYFLDLYLFFIFNKNSLQVWEHTVHRPVSTSVVGSKSQWGACRLWTWNLLFLVLISKYTTDISAMDINAYLPAEVSSKLFLCARPLGF